MKLENMEGIKVSELKVALDKYPDEAYVWIESGKHIRNLLIRVAPHGPDVKLEYRGRR